MGLNIAIAAVILIMVIGGAWILAQKDVKEKKKRLDMMQEDWDKKRKK